MQASKKFVKNNPLVDLNNFLLQVNQAFMNEDAELVIIKDLKQPLQEIQENTLQKQEKQPFQPSDDFQHLLNGLTTLLEKNLQESYNLQEIFQQQVNKNINDSSIKEDQLNDLSQQIKQNELKLLQSQNQRLLMKIEQLNEQITEVETELYEKNSNEKQLINLINSTYCIQRLQYQVNSIIQSVDNMEQGIFMIVDDQIILSSSYLDDNKMILNLSQITDVSYKGELQMVIHFNEGHLSLVMFTQQEFAKVDLALWSVMRRNSCLNQEKLFQNNLFEKPFRQEINIDQKKLKEQIINLIPIQEPIDQKQPILNIKSSGHQTEQLNNTQQQISPEMKQSTQTNQIQAQIIAQNKLCNAQLQLKQGFCMIKYSKGQRKPNIKIIYLTENELYLKWKEELEPFDQKNVSEKKSIQLGQIKEIKDGAFGQGFEKFKKQRQGKESLGITIIAKRTLELDAPKQEIKDLFLECLKIVLSNRNNQILPKLNK